MLSRICHPNAIDQDKCCSVLFASQINVAWIHCATQEKTLHVWSAAIQAQAGPPYEQCHLSDIQIWEISITTDCRITIDGTIMPDMNRKRQPLSLPATMTILK